ncbi:hypothetical protein EXN22_26085 [Pseudomonas tructae]|uniref:Uncharacterized protein n=1 Tax=Pseudomonas tructae TaxID=2518644 RepID=A0A411MQG8_9PSED|nr:hypothetical protein [Pseudomonas tructae]QBF28987.1 hypothetical protein EXN22_26085 [Pseudomonas tructae]
MNKGVAVKIHWTDEDKGGKSILPQGTPYYVITDLLEGRSGVKTNWSLVLEVENNSEGNHSRTGTGRAYFLVEDAPTSLLKSGYSLIVHEGRKQVARVEVI